MGDLISREAAIKAFTGKPPEYYHTDYIASKLRCLPAVDAVPVVRCRDCEHFIDMSGTSYPSYCYKHTTFDIDGEFDNVFSVEPDKYCAWGERRDSE